MEQWASKPTSATLLSLQHPSSQDPGPAWRELHSRLAPPGGESGQHPVGTALQEDSTSQGAQFSPQSGPLQMPHSPGSQAHNQRGPGPAPRPPGSCGRTKRGSWVPGLVTAEASLQSHSGEGAEMVEAPPHPLTHPSCPWPLNPWASPDPSCPSSPGRKGFDGLRCPGWALLPFRNLSSCTGCLGMWGPENRLPACTHAPNSRDRPHPPGPTCVHRETFQGQACLTEPLSASHPHFPTSPSSLFLPCPWPGSDLGHLPDHRSEPQPQLVGD